MALDIHNASIDELNKMISWATNEGWNPGLEDIRSFYLIDPRSFYVGYANQELVACASRAQYSPDFSFLGFFIVHPDYRFKKAAYEICQHVLHINRAQNMALDGVVQRIPKYQKLGFKLAHSNMRYMLENKNFAFNPSPHIYPISAIPLDSLADYDKAVFPAYRYPFLISWLTQPQTKTFAYYDKALLGYGAIRPAHTGYRIGPLFANNYQVALQLFQELCSSVEPGKPIYMDVPLSNQLAVQLCEEFNMQATFETGRMYSGVIPHLELDKIFGLTSLEVG
jgi:hypothetical protein